MRLFFKQLALGLFFASFAFSAVAEEPVLDFLEGLRQRQYYDTALQYLDEAEKLNLPPEVKEVIPYERAETLLGSSKKLNNLDEQRKRLDAAQASFEDFVKATPTHPLAARANTARGRILTEKARVEIWDGDKPSNEGSRDRFREAARKYVKEARRIFEQAADQHKAGWEAFPTFIPEDDFAQREKRDDAETQYMEAQLDLAQCTYWEAQTYDTGVEDRKKLLEQAAFEFEELHTKYRSQVAGLFARIWQGKCFEERGDIRIALGLYEEILGHPGDSSTMTTLKDRALRFRLICLNHDDRKDYQLVVDEGEGWIKQAKGRARTNIGLGIQYEVARALEAIGTDRTRPEPERNAALNRALTFARTINRFPGELKVLSSALIQRLMGALNRSEGDPQDFETASSLAGKLFEDILEQNNLINQAKAAGKIKEAADMQKGQQATAAEMARLYDLGIRMATAQTDPNLLNIARLRLSYGYLLQGQFLDAAVVADHQMVKFADASPETAKEAGFIAMTAFDYAYLDAAENDREFETAMLLESATKLADRWPESDRANDARNVVAKVFWGKDDYIQAADWWLKVPKGTGQYVDARLRAGKAYWRQFIVTTSLPEEERPASDELAKWKEESIKYLVEGVTAAEAEVPDDKPFADDVVTSKLTLAGIHNLDGNYAEAIKLLTENPHPITAAVDVPEGQARPTEAGKAQSRQIASVAYQTLLRAYIGIKDLDKARDARMKLEKVAGGEDAQALTQVFVAFGQELQSELERLRAENETDRLNDVRAGFESFLNDMFNRQDGQTFYSLLWIAETYASLADGSSDSPAKAEEYYEKAATSYQSIIEKGSSDSSFLADPKQLIGAKLLLVKCLRRKRDYPAAEKSMLEVVTDLPEVADVQFEAARLYQEWGATGGDNYERLQIALYGTPDKVVPKIWGWTTTAQRLERAARTAKTPGEQEHLAAMHFDARYALAESELQFGQNHPDATKSEEHLERARAVIIRFLRSSQRWPDDQYARFNTLYRKILEVLGEPVVDLSRETVVTPPTPPDKNGLVAKPTGGEEPPKTPQPKSNWLLMGLVLMLGIGLIGGIFYFTLSSAKGHRPKYEGVSTEPRAPRPVKLGNVSISTSTEPTLKDVNVAAKRGPRPAAKKTGTASGADAPKRPSAPGEERPRRPRPTGEGGTGEAPRPRQRPSGDAPPPQKRPRPKPPESS
ncbi:MAG: hypothetical protein KDA88_20675 [Planctomycetaceae bacterium]|nr:hypothetical protein [Planctomycetaceae bacterium]